jgi:hypothetical protein
MPLSMGQSLHLRPGSYGGVHLDQRTFAAPAREFWGVLVGSRTRLLETKLHIGGNASVATLCGTGAISLGPI